MPDLESTIRRAFPAPQPGGTRFAAASDMHAVNEAGFDVAFSRYSVSYRDREGSRDLAAEIDDEGVLRIRGKDTLVPQAAARVESALRYLGVRFTFD